MTRALAGMIGIAVAAAAFAGCVHRHESPPFAPWDLRGTIVEVGDQSMRVRHKSGQIVEVSLDDRTAVVGHEGTAMRSALIRGRRVIVSVEPLADGGRRAARVRVFGSG